MSKNAFGSLLLIQSLRAILRVTGVMLKLA